MLYLYKTVSEQGASIVRRNLNKELFENLEIYLPSKSEQIKIGSFLNNLDIKIEMLTNKKEKLDNIKNSTANKVEKISKKDKGYLNLFVKKYKEKCRQKIGSIFFIILPNARFYDIVVHRHYKHFHHSSKSFRCFHRLFFVPLCYPKNNKNKH